MNCLKAEEQFSEYLEDELDYPAVKAFENHLSSCEQCHREFTQFCESVDLLHQLPQIHPSPEFDAKLRTHLADTSVDSISFWYQVMNALRAQPVWAFSGMAALLVVFTGIYLFPGMLMKSSEVTGSRQSDAPEMRYVTRPEVVGSGRLQRERTLAAPDLRVYPLVRFPQFSESDAHPLPENQRPQRIERNYILQTVSYTDVPSGSGL